MIDTLDLRPPQRNTRGMIGVPTTLTASLLDADGEPKEAEAVDLYIGGPTSASWPLPDPLGDVTKITGTLDEETGLWMLAVPGLPAGMVLLRLVVDGALVGRLLHHVGSEGSTSPTTELVVRDGAGLVLHLTAIGSGDGGGGGTVDSVARAAITSHTEETTAAHGGIVASTDPRLTDARDPKAHTQAITTITGLEDALGSKANTADLATVAGTGSYTDLDDTPTLGTAAAQDSTAFATAAQGSKADAAVPNSRTLAGLDLTADRAAADLRTALGVRPGAIAPPLPCALSIMASRIGSNVSAVSGTVYWLPLELLAISVKATHLWLSVSTTGLGVARLGITSAVSAADDTPGPLLASTAAAAVDATSTGSRGAALSSPLTLTAGVRYYLTAYISTAAVSAVGVEGPLGLLASATGSAPVTPAATMAPGWRLTGQSDLVSNPTGLVPTNVMPLMHVSLEAP